MRLAIIGTAGRAEDGKRLREEPGHWRAMKAIAQAAAVFLHPDEVVSGGSAWADHIAVQLYLDSVVPKLTLHLPAPFMTYPGTHLFEPSHECGKRLNELHGLFQQYTGINPFEQLAEAIKRGAQVCQHHGGFRARNTHVANGCDALLAFTFGKGVVLADGGTQDTVAKYLARRTAEAAREAKERYARDMNGDTITPVYPAASLPAYHYCLNMRRLFSL